MGKRRVAFTAVVFILAWCILPMVFYITNTWGAPTAISFAVWLFSIIVFAAVWAELDNKIAKLYEN